MDDNFLPERIEPLPDALPPEDTRLVRDLQIVYQSEVDRHKRSLERVRARLAQEEAFNRVSLPTPEEPLKGKIMNIKNVMEAKGISWGKNSSSPLMQAKKPSSFVRTVSLGLVAAVAAITILSFILSSNVLYSAQTLVGKIGQEHQSPAISHGKQVCTFSTTTNYAVGSKLLVAPNLDWSTQGQIAVAGDDAFQVVSAHDCQTAFSQALQKNYTVRWSPDGSKVVIASTKRTLDVFDRQGHSLLHKTFAQLGADSAGDVFWSSDSTQLVFVSENDHENSFSDSIKSVNVSSGRNVTTLMTLPTDRLPIFFSPDGKFFITTQTNAANTKEYDFWDLNRKKQVSTLLSPIPDSRGMVTFSPDGSQVAIAENKQVEIYTTANGKLISSFRAAQMPTHGSMSLAWSPDGKYLAEGTNAITIYDVQTMKAVTTFGQVDAQHTITTLAWAPDSKGLVFATGPIAISSPEGTVQVWTLG